MVNKELLFYLLLNVPPKIDLECCFATEIQMKRNRIFEYRGSIDFNQISDEKSVLPTPTSPKRRIGCRAVVSEIKSSERPSFVTAGTVSGLGEFAENIDAYRD